MPRKDFEGAPMHDAGKIGEKERKEVFEKDREHRDEGSGSERHYSGAGESGSGDRAGQVQKTKD